MTGGLRRAAAGAVTAQIAWQALETWTPGGRERWQRTNHRGATVSLLSGPALALAAAGSGGVTVPLAAAGAAVIGRYDDVRGGGDEAKGFGGHLGALRAGRLTAGAVKVVGISAVGIVAGACVRPRRPGDVLLAGAVIAGSANLVNLLDLRPGRALKVGLAGAVALGQPGLAGACTALLPADLDERTMLGDAGANALGAALGVAFVSRVRSRLLRKAALTVLVALTAASEVVSFSDVIDRTPALRRLDQLGRRT